MSVAVSLLKRELSLGLKQGSGFGLSIIFFLSVVLLFPFGIGPNLKQLALFAPAIIWSAVVLSILLGLEKLFQPDAEDGTLDLYRLSALNMEGVVFIKALAYWLQTALPLIMLTPIFGAMLGMNIAQMGPTIFSLLLGTPSLVFFGTICAALTVKLKRSGLLIAILAIPLLIPVLIFGVSLAGAVDMTAAASTLEFYILLALLLFSALLAIIAGAQSLKTR